MKKLLLFLLCSFSLMACTRIAVYTFSVNNEEISIQMDRSLSLKQREDGFSIETENENIQGMFIQTSVYIDYKNTVINDESVNIVFQDENKIIWQIQGDSGLECNCLCKVSNNTSILMGSLDDVQDIYKNITFKMN